MTPTQTPTLADLTPPEIDELWAAAIAGPSRALQAANETLKSGRRYRRAGGYYAERAERTIERGERERDAALEQYRAASAPFDGEFERRGGWTRYLLVVASNGHVHSPSCHTMVPGQTMVSPVFELSGQDGAGVVAAAGHTACSKCFPDAPVETVEDKRAANVAKGRCGGTGMQSSAIRPGGRYGRCSECGGVFGISTHGVIRPHKAAVAG